MSEVVAPPAAGVEAGERKLRVVLLWNESILADETIDTPRPIVFGDGPDALYALPDSLGISALMLLEPQGPGYRLRIFQGLDGAVWIGGQRRDIARIESDHIDLGPDDYGVVTLGTIAIFFQHVVAAKKPKRVLFPVDGPLTASQALSVLLHALLFFGLVWIGHETDRPDPLEISPELLRRFTVTPPPEPPPETHGGTDTPDPGLRDRDDSGGRAAEREEGRVGHENAQQEQTEMQGEINGGAAAARVRTLGLLGELTKNTNPLAGLLEGPSVNDMLGGLGSSRTVFGRGSGGSGLRGSGNGGGGDGPGTLFGGHGVGTGVGAGNGSGGGRGRGGVGAPGHGRGEVGVRVSLEQPRVSGYLSAEQILRVVRQNQAAVRYCYEQELQRQPTLRGTIEVGWTIDRQGHVTRSRIARTSMNNSRVEGCLARQVRNWRFPEPDGGEVEVAFPFQFGASGG